MQTIKFSHPYNKLKDSFGKILSKALLLDVVITYISQRSKMFLKYDTEEIFKLPDSGIYMMLLFQKPYIHLGDATNLFTTLRRHTGKLPRAQGPWL